jgi:hypothetical protein
MKIWSRITIFGWRYAATDGEQVTVYEFSSPRLALAAFARGDTLPLDDAITFWVDGADNNSPA